MYVCVPRGETVALAAAAWTFARLLCKIDGGQSAHTTAFQIMNYICDLLEAVDSYDRRMKGETFDVKTLINEGFDEFLPLMRELCEGVDNFGIANSHE